MLMRDLDLIINSGFNTTEQGVQELALAIRIVVMLPAGQEGIGTTHANNRYDHSLVSPESPIELSRPPFSLSSLYILVYNINNLLRWLFSTPENSVKYAERAFIDTEFLNGHEANTWLLKQWDSLKPMAIFP
jgi:hypothetical protein